MLVLAPIANQNCHHHASLFNGALILFCFSTMMPSSETFLQLEVPQVHKQDMSVEAMQHYIIPAVQQ